MKKIELTEATKPLAEYVKEMDGQSVMIMYKGVALAALVPMDNADYETVSLSTNPEFIAMLERPRARGRKEGGISTNGGARGCTAEVSAQKLGRF
jgi:antitoxin (DNA-binding transcriptional repressor) of toxin-antitoxin stability system